MKHIAQESLIEFIREKLLPTEAAVVREHVSECDECSDVADLVREIMRVGANEIAYEPADGLVRTVKAYFEAEHRKKADQKCAVALLFDTLTQPLTAGVRASVASARQLLYRIGTVYVDMRVDSELNSNRVALVGQMLDSARPGHPVAGVPVILLDGRKSVTSTVSNDNGEFHLEFEIKSNLRLSVTVADNAPVYLPITGIEERKRPAVPTRGPN